MGPINPNSNSLNVGTIGTVGAGSGSLIAEEVPKQGESIASNSSNPFTSEKEISDDYLTIFKHFKCLPSYINREDLDISHWLFLAKNKYIKLKDIPDSIRTLEFYRALGQGVDTLDFFEVPLEMRSEALAEKYIKSKPSDYLRFSEIPDEFKSKNLCLKALGLNSYNIN